MTASQARKKKEQGGGCWHYFSCFVAFLTSLVYKCFVVFVATARRESEQMQWVEEMPCTSCAFLCLSWIQNYKALFCNKAAMESKRACQLQHMSCHFLAHA